MSHLTNYAEELIGNAMLRGGTLTWPTTWHVALFTAASSPEAGTVTEVSGGDYAREAIANGSSAWNAPTAGNGVFDNAADIDFGDPSANWGTVTHWGLYDAASSGNLWLCVPFASSYEILSAATNVKFAAGALDITFA